MIRFGFAVSMLMLALTFADGVCALAVDGNPELVAFLIRPDVTRFIVAGVIFIAFAAAFAAAGLIASLRRGAE